MTVLRAIGFFREFDSSLVGAPSIHDSIRESPHVDESYIVAYLKSGIGLAARAGYVKDVIAPATQVSLLAHILTDGVHYWRSDLPYYVKKYHVGLPEDFIDHMRLNNWTVPKEGDIDFDSIDMD